MKIRRTFSKTLIEQSLFFRLQIPITKSAIITKLDKSLKILEQRYFRVLLSQDIKDYSYTSNIFRALLFKKFKKN